MTFVQKRRAKNVDEIDYRSVIPNLGYVKNLKWYASLIFSMKMSLDTYSQITSDQ